MDLAPEDTREQVEDDDVDDCIFSEEDDDASLLSSSPPSVARSVPRVTIKDDVSLATNILLPEDVTDPWERECLDRALAESLQHLRPLQSSPVVGPSPSSINNNNSKNENNNSSSSVDCLTMLKTASWMQGWSAPGNVSQVPATVQQRLSHICNTKPDILSSEPREKLLQVCTILKEMLMILEKSPPSHARDNVTGEVMAELVLYEDYVEFANDTLSRELCLSLSRQHTSTSSSTDPSWWSSFSTPLVSSPTTTSSPPSWSSLLPAPSYTPCTPSPATTPRKKFAYHKLQRRKNNVRKSLPPVPACGLFAPSDCGTPLGVDGVTRTEDQLPQSDSFVASCNKTLNESPDTDGVLRLDLTSLRSRQWVYFDTPHACQVKQIKPRNLSLLPDGLSGTGWGFWEDGQLRYFQCWEKGTLSSYACWSRDGKRQIKP